MRVFRIGFIVNPIAGIGGAAGLKGSDGAVIQMQARALGYKAHSGSRATRFLAQLSDLRDDCELLTGSGDLGATSAKAAGWHPHVMYHPPAGPTSAEDSRQLAAVLLADGVDVLVFVGGDGTARDVAAVVGTDVLCLGVPAGVKMQSAVFGVTPEAAATLLRASRSGRARSTAAEVVDVDEDALREGVVSSRLYGVVKSPQLEALRQARKIGSSTALSESLGGIARECMDHFQPGAAVLLGPGSTVAEVAHGMGLETTLLGVDVVVDGRLVARDVDARELHEVMRDRELQVVVSPVGGQGVILGRGNQQIDAEVLRLLPKRNLIVLATPSKLAGLPAGRLYVDLPFPDMNARWTGPVRVIVGYRQEAVVEVATV